MSKPVRFDIFAPDDIVVGERLRPLDPAQVNRLVDSVREIGLRHPVSVRIIDGDAHLIAGFHRIEACRRAGLPFVECAIFDGDERDARLWEIAENLHRAELTPLERSEHIAAWLRLTEEREVFGQVAQKPKGGRPEGGLSAATRELGIERTDARRAVKIDSLPEEAKEVAREVGLDRNQSALLKAAGADDPVAALRAHRADQGVHEPEVPADEVERDGQQSPGPAAADIMKIAQTCAHSQSLPALLANVDPDDFASSEAQAAWIAETMMEVIRSTAVIVDSEDVADPRHALIVDALGGAAYVNGLLAWQMDGAGVSRKKPKPLPPSLDLIKRGKPYYGLADAAEKMEVDLALALEAQLVIAYGTPEENKQLERGEIKLHACAERIRARLDWKKMEGSD